MWVTQCFSLPVPSPTVTIASVPIAAPHYTGLQFILGCYSQIEQAVDTDVNVTHTWSRAYRLYYSWKSWSNPRVTQSPVSQENSVMYSHLYFTPLHVRDNYFYSCESTVYPSPEDPKSQYLVKSESESAKHKFDMSPRKLSMDQLSDPQHYYIINHAFNLLCFKLVHELHVERGVVNKSRCRF